MKLFKTHSEREVKRIYPIVNKIESLRDHMKSLSDDQLKDYTNKFKEQLASGKTLDDILPEAFAVVREAAFRTIGLEPYPVQLIGGIVLHQGRIAEMKTGEGKTLVAVLPSYLNALAGKGVHVVTVNDYLAHRDAEWMGQIHRFLGLTVGCVLNGMNSIERQEAYNCDITYVTNSELGFDYLRDNMVTQKDKLVLRDLSYAIIDEVDSILIDEARTPLIISGQGQESTKLYESCDTLAKWLEKGEVSGELTKMAAIMKEEITETGDFIVDEKDKYVTLTEQGVKKVEKFFHIDNLADIQNIEIQHNIIMALKANYLMHIDKDYVVKDGEVLIVDEFTGRIMPGRRYSDGLHQALEAKEFVEIQRESKTLATITYQNFFNKYAKKAGMTGTAITEEDEFRDIYSMDVVAIPTNKPVQRIDYPDLVYMTKKEKYHEIVEAVKESYKKQQPVLVGTATIDVSELLSKMLTAEGIPHQVLNAKFHELEAEIVSHAGEIGMVTIATNMAGRGTDIKLGEGVVELGGLRIIGTERHESRRIDNQLRGRAGRQGDPGESRFYISLEDDLMRLFGSERLMSLFSALHLPENTPISHKMLSSTIEKAQKSIESNNFGIRKSLLDFDLTNNEQRELIYRERRKILNGDNMKDTITSMICDIITNITTQQLKSEHYSESTWELADLSSILKSIIPLKAIELDMNHMPTRSQLIEQLQNQALAIYANKEAEFDDSTQLREVERLILLRVIDQHWMQHIDDLEKLRDGIGLQAYANKDPKIAYKIEAYKIFDQMADSIQQDTIRLLYNVQSPKAIAEQKQREAMKPKITVFNAADLNLSAEDKN